MRLDDILSRASKAGRARIAVVGAADPEVLRAVRIALDEGVAEPILVGAGDAIRAAARAGGIALDGMAIVDAGGDREASSCAASLVRAGEVDALLKGSVATSALMQVGLREGLKREGRLVSHIALVELPGERRALAITDCALIPFPSFDQRVEIVRNAAACLSRLGVARPKVALLSASEEVNPKIPSSLEAARIAEMARPGGPLAGIGAVEGPLDFGCAIDGRAARIKGVAGEVAGCADVIVAPDIVSANTLAKAFAYLGGSPVAACAVGGAVPIGMVSRASHAEDKYKALLFALACR
jgi:phosphate acetyltransferase